MAILQLNWLAVENFGAFKGKHKVRFANSSDGKPITLFGGQNGAGKTTLLEAILFVLHGKNAPTQKRSKSRYQDYLGSLVNRHSSSREASVTLNFSSIENGQATKWEVTRYVIKKKVNYQDSLYVEVNDEFDEAVTARWPIEVESLWPRHLCNILFFDGERLQELASPEATSAALKEAMRLLLGGLPVSRAVGDLIELEKRILDREDISAPDREKLEIIRAEIKERKKNITELLRKLASLRSKKDATILKRDRLDEAFSSQGGEVVVKTHEYQAEKEALIQERQVVQQGLLSLSGSYLPLSLVHSETKSLETVVEDEQIHAKNLNVKEYVGERDSKFLKWFEDNLSGQEVDLVDKVQIWLDSNAPKVKKETVIYHASELSNDLQILKLSVETEKQQAQQLSSRYQEIGKKILTIEQLLQELPGEDDIILMKENLLSLEAESRHLERQITDFEQQLSQRRAHVERLELSEQIQIKKAGKSLDKKAAGTRALDQLPDLITFFRDYEKELLLNSLKEMEQHIFSCFNYLFKKENVVHELTIDPDSFEIKLLGENSESVEIERLSAGERQMLATSIIWALSKLSGNSAPVVIDTPVGRLDSDYRSKFIGSYLPNAGNQIIVLSTDEEIHESYYPLVADAVGAEYGIQFNEKLNTSEITVGYPYKTRTKVISDEVRCTAA